MMSIVSYLVVLVFLHQGGYITASTGWPGGIYGLLKPKTGCPKEWKENNWEENGWINQSTIYYKVNEKSKDLHIDGNVFHSKVERYFCIKNGSSTNAIQTWPKGQYCIYKRYSTYPIHGMTQTGSIQMTCKKDCHWTPSSASMSCKKYFVDTLGRETNLHFSCQTSGNKKIPISLPITKPFYLLPYGSTECQQVKWMLATSEWIWYNTCDYATYWNRRPFPYHELGTSSIESGIKMFYCYYKSCNYTLKNSSDVFHSPRFPNKYPDGQLCSWRIKVRDNHTLVVNFTKFSLHEYDKDCLQLYENTNGIFEPKHAFFGHQRPFTITATSDLMFVFRSDEENESNGFRAEYTMFRTPAKMTSAAPTSPTTTTSPPTTTQPTTKLTTTKLPTTEQPTTKRSTTKWPITTELETIANNNSATNETCQCCPTNSKNKSYNKQPIHVTKKTFCEETWRIVVMVIPLAVLILIALVIIDIICRCRSRKDSKSGAKGSSGDDGMVVNPTYGRGSIVLDQPAATVTDTSMPNTVVGHPQSRDDLDDYEDVDYTQLNEVPPPRRSSKRQECHELEPIDVDTSTVFYHVLEPSNTESGLPAKPFGNGAPEVFYHTLEPPIDSTAPAYQNPSEGNHYTLNPLYEAAENSAPFVEVNKLYDSYM